jgi:hypothetical protein
MTKEQVDALVVRVYRRRLDDACKGDADRQAEKVGHDAQVRYAQIYRPVVVATLIELGLYERPANPRKSPAV